MEAIAGAGAGPAICRQLLAGIATLAPCAAVVALWASSACVSAFGVFQSSLVVLLAVKLGGFAVRFGGCAVKFRSLDMMCLRHERISSLEIAPQQTPFGFRSSGAGGAAGSESTHARLNLEYPDRKPRGEPGAQTAVFGFGCADEANASAAIPVASIAVEKSPPSHDPYVALLDACAMATGPQESPFHFESPSANPKWKNALDRRKNGWWRRLSAHRRALVRRQRERRDLDQDRSPPDPGGSRCCSKQEGRFPRARPLVG